ncbi:tail completion protein gp17 [Novosphingobium sp.]|uniref:tail completion protein gp17 n=1 Tax=Novosphingobium sp. TaxID=1874826 RepID=UPI003D6D2F0C
MDGVAALVKVLTTDAALVLLVPEERISPGPSPLGFALPWIALESVSVNDRNIPAPGVQRHVRERVQVTVMARDYPQRTAVMRAVRRAAADRLDVEVEGIEAVTIHTDSAGPDFMIEDASIWCRTQDFLVTYLETR